MFNVKVKKFYDTEQIQIYSTVFRSEGEITREKKFDKHTGEIVKSNAKQMYVPFTDEYEWVSPIPDRAESERVSLSRTIRSIYDVARSNPWEWFVTFTFSPQKVNRYDYSECSKCLSKWLNNMRRKCPDMVYIVVPEMHKDGAFHFHGLFMDIDEMDLVDSGKVDKSGNVIYNLGSYKLGWTTATKINDFRRASSYLCKYITKDLIAVSRGKKRYWCSKNVLRPIVEEFLIEESHDEILRRYSEGCSYVKNIESAYTNVTYIEKDLSIRKT